MKEFRLMIELEQICFTLNNDRQVVCLVENRREDIPCHQCNSVFRQDQHMLLVVD